MSAKEPHLTDTRPGASPDDLFRRFRDGGDAAALGELFDRTGDALHRIALAQVRDAATAEDAVQETFLAAIEFAPRWDASRPVVPWLVGILRHKAAALRAAGARRVDADDGRLLRRLPPVDPAGDAAAREDAERLRAAMEALPEPYRHAALLRWRHGLDPVEIAHLTGEPRVAIRVRLHRALARLRARVRDGAALGVVAWSGPSARGLDAVRDALVRRAASRAALGPPANAPGTPAAGAFVAAAVVLAAAGGAAWWIAGAPQGAPGDGAAHAAAKAPDTGVPRDTARAAPPASSGAAPGDVVAPVPTPPDTRPWIAGRVLGPDGRGVAGARVVAVARRFDAGVALSSLGGEDQDRGAAAAAGDDGEFRIAGCAPGPMDVIARAPGFAPAVRESVRPEDRIELRLVPETAFHARLVDPQGRPVAGADVRVLAVTGSCALAEERATSDGDGLVRVGGLAPDGHAAARARWVEIRAAGFAPVQTALALGDGARRDVVLFPGVRMVVTVTDGETGAPLGGATVAWGFLATGIGLQRGPSRSYQIPHPSADLGVATTGADGIATFADAPAERVAHALFVRAWKDGWTADAAQTNDRGETGPITVRASLWPAATLRGRVVDATGAPVPRAGVHVTPAPAQWFPAPVPGAPWQGAVQTDDDGRYEYAGARGGRASAAEITVHATPPWGDDLRDVAFLSRDRAQTKVAARAGSVTDVPDLVLPAPRPLPRAVVRVADAAGAPVAGARVVSAGTVVLDAQTDRSGRATLGWHVDAALFGPAAGPRGPDPNAPRVVHVRAEGFAAAAVRVVPSAASPPEVVVSLAPGATLAGRVADGAGRPVADASVWAVFVLAGEEASAGTMSAADGTFVLRGLPAGAPAEVHASRVWGGNDFHRQGVAQGAVAGGPPVEIVLAGDALALGAIEGRVTDADTGVPVAGFEVEVLSRPITATAQAHALTAGRFAAPEVPEGTWTVRVHGRGRLTEDVRATVLAGRTTQLAVTLARGVTLSGRADLPADVLARRPQVRLARTDLGPADAAPPGAGPWAFLEPDGAFRIAAARPGVYAAMVQVSEPGKARAFVAATPVVVRAAAGTARAAQELTLSFAAAGFISVRIDDPAAHEQTQAESEGEAPPPSEGALEFLGAGGARVALVRGLWRGGTFHAVLAPGDVTIVLHLPGREPRRLAARVVAGETAEVVFGER